MQLDEALISAGPPLAIGSRDAESLGSYVLRLSESLGVLPGQVVFRLLAWRDRGRAQCVGLWSRRAPRLRIGWNPSSFHHAQVWLRTLGQIVDRPDLAATTTAAWDHLFPTRTFQRHALAWCPLCLAADPIPYHRLAWTIEASRCCVEHKQVLEIRCPRCGRYPKLFHERSTILRCPHCYSDLRQTSRPASVPTPFDMWKAGEVGQLIASAHSATNRIAWDSGASLRRVAGRLRCDDAATLGRLVGVSRITAWYWWTGRSRPSLPLALRAFYILGGSLAEEITGQRWPTSSGTIEPELHLPARRKARCVDWRKLRQALEGELRKCDEVISLTEFARRHNTHPRTLRIRFPRLSARLSGRFQETVGRRAELRQRSIEKEIKRAVAALAKRNQRISQRAVAALLGRSGLFCRPTARDALRKTVANLSNNSGLGL